MWSIGCDSVACADALSLVAEEGGGVVGHVLLRRCS